MHDEDRDQEPDYLEEHLDRRRHAISDYFVGLALFVFSILAMAIGLESAPARTTSASDQPLSALVIARPATLCIDDRSSEAMRLRHVPGRNINTLLAPRKV
ncbi:hypothetical protein C9413_06045 [Rhizobium sp. SEMIA 4085]|uniref:hypothetical protein n=1 Tax=Rhizobium TaxID=379 RepID=UPI001478E7B7|nr:MULTISPECIES: hypothetical protein [Rhizobium]NNH29082.1 hypothetical protein [Rhizobium sp. SEMIA 4085]